MALGLIVKLLSDPDVAAGRAGNGQITAAFEPNAAGPWMCPAAGGPVNPVKLRVTLAESSSAASCTIPTPLPVLAFGGTSFALLRTARNVRCTGVMVGVSLSVIVRTAEF